MKFTSEQSSSIAPSPLTWINAALGASLSVELSTEGSAVEPEAMFQATSYRSPFRTPSLPRRLFSVTLEPLPAEQSPQSRHVGNFSQACLAGHSRWFRQARDVGLLANRGRLVGMSRVQKRQLQKCHTSQGRLKAAARIPGGNLLRLSSQMKIHGHLPGSYRSNRGLLAGCIAVYASPFPGSCHVTASCFTARAKSPAGSGAAATRDSSASCAIRS
jgi:hypothetical protein